jgi:GMP synthase-like glutamine amidotransferase
VKAVFVADNVDRDPGLLGDFLEGVGAQVRYVDREKAAVASIAANVLILLGSDRSAHDPVQASVVEAEIELIRRSLSDGIPVIGICYGAQVLARALGGSSGRGELAECGWTEVYSEHRALCPPGYWAQMHHDVIVPAESSTVIGWSPAGPQAFTDDSRGARAIGWQFHPELRVSTLERWMARHYSGSEEADPEETIRNAIMHARESTPRAATLFRSALRYLDVANHELGRD